eukprot:3112926-Pleurochrysis_carterae.AAC.1
MFAQTLLMHQFFYLPAYFPTFSSTHRVLFPVSPFDLKGSCGLAPELLKTNDQDRGFHFANSYALLEASQRDFGKAASSYNLKATHLTKWKG